MQKILWTENFVGRKFCRQKILWIENFVGRKFCGQKILQMENFVGRKFCGQKILYEITVATTIAATKFKRKLKNKSIKSIQDEPKEAWKNVDEPLEANITGIIPTESKI